MSGGAQHLDLDRAWPDDLLGLPRLDAIDWGRQLRFSAPARRVEEFYAEIGPQLAPFVIYGSGDFHHLTAIRARRVETANVIVSFDNHPDWAVTPPRWACGAWINRALELPHIERVSVWGCGNFECWWPGQILGNRRAEREGRLEVHPWVDDRSAKDQQRRGAILQNDWRERFQAFARALHGGVVYLTIDMDCLRPEEAVTNWENGRFAVADLVWALGQLREHCRVAAGDICGAFSEPHYARWTQKLAADFDHPKIQPPPPDRIRAINVGAVERIWPALIGSGDSR